MSGTLENRVAVITRAGKGLGQGHRREPLPGFGGTDLVTTAAPVFEQEPLRLGTGIGLVLDGDLHGSLICTPSPERGPR